MFSFTLNILTFHESASGIIFQKNNNIPDEQGDLRSLLNLEHRSWTLQTIKNGTNLCILRTIQDVGSLVFVDTMERLLIMQWEVVTLNNCSF